MLHVNCCILAVTNMLSTVCYVLHAECYKHVEYGTLRAACWVLQTCWVLHAEHYKHGINSVTIIMKPVMPVTHTRTQGEKTSRLKSWCCHVFVNWCLAWSTCKTDTYSPVQVELRTVTVVSQRHSVCSSLSKSRRPIFLPSVRWVSYTGHWGKYNNNEMMHSP